MRKAALVIVLFLFSLSSFCQEDTSAVKERKILYGFNLGYTRINQYSNKWAFNFSVMSNTKHRHTLFAGITFNDETGANSYGYQGGCKIFPNSNRSRFDFYFEYMLHFVQHEGIGGSPDIKIKYAVLDNTLGYGFQFNISKTCYLNSSLGFGLGNERKYVNGNLWDKYPYLISLVNGAIGINF